MGTLNAFYVRKTIHDPSATLHALFPKGRLSGSSSLFLGVLMPDNSFEPPESELADLSVRLSAEVFWLGYQSVVDAFAFHYWREGRSIRSLVYGCNEERTWERVWGNAQPWEREIFFNPRDLEFYLEDLQDFGSESDREELKWIWQEGELLPGRSEPTIDSRSCALSIAKHYGFPLL